jgi:hypothetical protein
MMRRLLLQAIRLGTLAAVFTLFAHPVFAQGVVVSQTGSDLLVTISAEAANIAFTFTLNGCDNNVPCFQIGAGTGMVGIPVSAGAGCKAKMGNAFTPSGIECPASGIGSITFQFMKGGTWAAYAGGGGQHAGGPCSPAPVTIKTGPDGGMVSVNSWNGCKETVICNSPASMFTAVEADNADEIRGTCSSVIRH